MDEKKQIEEMAKLACSIFDGNCMGCSFNFYPPCPPKASAKRLFAAGYRKQSEAEWITIDPNPQFVEGCKQIVVDCSNCTIRRTIPAANYHGYNYCPNCGAKLKGE